MKQDREKTMKENRNKWNKGKLFQDRSMLMKNKIKCKSKKLQEEN